MQSSTRSSSWNRICILIDYQIWTAWNLNNCLSLMKSTLWSQLSCANCPQKSYRSSWFGGHHSILATWVKIPLKEINILIQLFALLAYFYSDTQVEKWLHGLESWRPDQLVTEEECNKGILAHWLELGWIILFSISNLSSARCSF